MFCGLGERKDVLEQTVRPWLKIVARNDLSFFNISSTATTTQNDFTVATGWTWGKKCCSDIFRQNGFVSVDIRTERRKECIEKSMRRVLAFH